jgi:hypothetical protein
VRIGAVRSGETVRSGAGRQCGAERCGDGAGRGDGAGLTTTKHAWQRKQRRRSRVLFGLRFYVGQNTISTKLFQPHFVSTTPWSTFGVIVPPLCPSTTISPVCPSAHDVTFVTPSCHAVLRYTKHKQRLTRRQDAGKRDQKTNLRCQRNGNPLRRNPLRRQGTGRVADERQREAEC